MANNLNEQKAKAPINNVTSNTSSVKKTTSSESTKKVENSKKKNDDNALKTFFKTFFTMLVLFYTIMIVFDTYAPETLKEHMPNLIVERSADVHESFLNATDFLKNIFSGAEDDSDYVLLSSIVETENMKSVSFYVPANMELQEEGITSTKYITSKGLTVITDGEKDIVFKVAENEFVENSQEFMDQYVNDTTMQLKSLFDIKKFDTSFVTNAGGKYIPTVKFNTKDENQEDVTNFIAFIEYNGQLLTVSMNYNGNDLKNTKVFKSVVNSVTFS